jgi:type II secretory pathway component GspD/PulD (secretin)
MRIRTLVAITLTMFAVPAVGAELPAAPMPREAARLAILYKLRNVAAADAARALAAHVGAGQLPARITFDAAANNVYVSAAPALQRQLGEMIAALDTAPPQVVVTATVIQAPRGFAADCGLTGEPAAWALSPREQTMFTALVRGAKARGDIDILARPQVQVAHNQTGVVEIGQRVPVVLPGAAPAGGVVAPMKVAYVQAGLTLRVTPRVSPDGGVLLRAGARITALRVPEGVVGSAVLGAASAVAQVVPPPDVQAQTAETAVELKDGQTMVLVCSDRGATGGLQRLGGDRFETLVILTPHVVRPEPAPGWFLK